MVPGFTAEIRTEYLSNSYPERYLWTFLYGVIVGMLRAVSVQITVSLGVTLCN
jgi:hypothetical protein